LNVKTVLLGLFVALTIVLASTTVYEWGTRTTALTSISTLTSTLTQASTVTNIGTTTSTIVPELSQNPSIAITSTKLIIATPDLCIIYNATVLNNGTEPVDNITMAFQNYAYHSNVTIQNTLKPGQSTSFSFCYYNYNTFATQPPPLHLVLIYGTFEGNQPFAFIERIQLAWTDGAPI
jgi:hypothetical protein